MVVKPRPGLYIVFSTNAGEAAVHTGAPCEGAVKIDVTDVDYLLVDDPRKVRYQANDPHCTWWYGQGTNHRVEGGVIKRDVGIRSVWAVEVEDLMAFADQYGDIVLSRGQDGFAYLEIYDDFRE